MGCDRTVRLNKELHHLRRCAPASKVVSRVLHQAQAELPGLTPKRIDMSRLIHCDWPCRETSIATGASYLSGKSFPVGKLYPPDRCISKHV
jgi:hypothetical protein